MKVPEFDKHLKKAGGNIGQNVEEMTIKMKTIVRKPLMIKKHRTMKDSGRDKNEKEMTTNYKEKKNKKN